MVGRISVGSCCIPFHRTRDARLRLVCFPHAGGRPSAFRKWAAALPPDIEVFGAEVPGRGHGAGEPQPSGFETAVEQMVPALLALADRPLAFFGHSLGAVIAFETARRVRQHCPAAVRHLFVAGRRAPQVPDTDPPMHDKPDEEFIAYLHELKGTPAEVLDNPEMLELLLPILRADFKLAETYRYVDDEPLGCGITVFGGTEDEESLDDRLAAWRLQTTGRFAIHMLAGDHFFPLSNQQELLRLLNRELSSLAPPLEGLRMSEGRW